MNQVTDVTRRGCLQNIMQSFVGALLGVALFFGSFVLLWYNEGRVNLAIVASRSVEMSTERVHDELNGKLVAATGNLASAEPLGDGRFITPGDYLVVERTVEMYAWSEERHSTTRKKLGGGSETVTTYTYDQEWTSDPDDSASFREKNGHTNPPMAYASATVKAEQVTLGAYAVQSQQLTFPAPSALTLNAATIRDEKFALQNNYLLSRRAALTTPRVGDLRISYGVVPSAIEVTLFGKADSDRIDPFVVEEDTLLYRAFTEDRAAAIKTMDTEYTTMLWILRFAGFVLMWVGLAMAFSPINAVLNIVPLAGSVSGFLIGAVTFVVALVLSVVTIVIAFIAHNIFLLVGVAIVVGVAAVMLIRQRSQRRQAAGSGW